MCAAHSASDWMSVRVRVSLWEWSLKSRRINLLFRIIHSCILSFAMTTNFLFHPLSYQPCVNFLFYFLVVHINFAFLLFLCACHHTAKQWRVFANAVMIESLRDNTFEFVWIPKRSKVRECGRNWIKCWLRKLQSNNFFCFCSERNFNFHFYFHVRHRPKRKVLSFFSPFVWRDTLRERGTGGTDKLAQ